MKIFTNIFVAFIMFFAGFSMVDALTISPASVYVEGIPGETSITKVKLKNETRLPLKVEASTGVFQGVVGDESGKAQITEGSPSSWAKINIDSVSLQPGQETEVPIVINIPSDIGGGGYNLAVKWFEVSEKKDSIVENGVGISGGAATLILLDVKGSGRVENGEVVEFTTKDGLTSYQKLPVVFSARLRNSGNVPLKPTGSITVKNMFGSVVATLPFNVVKGDSGYIPQNGGIRKYDTDWQGEFAFGKYTALLNVDLGGAGVKAASLDLWVMPAGLLVLWLIIALIILVILVLLIRRALLSSPAMKK